MTALSELIARANKDSLTNRQVAERARALGERISPDAAWRVMTGRTTEPKEPALKALSSVFSIPLDELRHAASLPTETLGPYVPPPESERIGQRERQAVDTVIRLFAAARPNGETDLAPLDLSDLPDEVMTDVLDLRTELDRRANQAAGEGRPALAPVLAHLADVLRIAINEEGADH